MDTSAVVTLEQVEAGFAITAIDLTLRASIPNVEEQQFQELAVDAKANCPVSKVLNAKISLDAALVTAGG
jgi:osmotically inducible protein OsmC